MIMCEPTDSLSNSMSKTKNDPGWIGMTFDDFLMRPQLGKTESRQHISLNSRLTQTLDLELPIVSSNMDSVTGARMAEAMALTGGLGVIHRAQSIERQAQEVAEVKRSYSAVIEHPHCLPVGTTLAEAEQFAKRHKITGILIETKGGSGILAGLLSSRDIPWQGDHQQRRVEEFMTPLERLHTHKPDISIEDAEQILFDKRIERLPLVDSENRIHGLITSKDVRFIRERPFASKDTKGHLLVGAAIGARGDFIERTAALLEAGADCFFIDIAHGHSMVMQQAVEAVRSKFGAIPLACGNVATAEGAMFMKGLGVDAIKVGVGPGRGCRTRLETSAGVPQLQAIRETWSAVGESVPIIADGGVRYDKDIFLALICGASTVMLGSALSGTDEAPGRVIEDPATHTKKKIYRGMTSPEAVLESLYDVDDGEAITSALETPAEGQEIQVPYKGSVQNILHRIRGHLRSAVSYAGEASLNDARVKILPDPFEYLIPLSESSRRESYER
ncbi:MAG: inosine-5'-monophosphate dehydrogenase [marine bacterium B5-7]|nr:MAG: inosine-5'-monophosphate dehydrogenase [marine bacterium B5-7]